MLAERTAEACSIMVSQGKPYAVERPLPWQGGVSMFHLLPLKSLVRRGGQIARFHQCRYDSATAKPTQVLYSGAAFEQLERFCNHPKVQQRNTEGALYWGGMAIYQNAPPYTSKELQEQLLEQRLK